MLLNKDVVLTIEGQKVKVPAGSHLELGTNGSLITEDVVAFLDGQAYMLEEGDRVSIGRPGRHPLLEDLGVDVPVDDDDEFEVDRYDVGEDEYDQYEEDDPDDLDDLDDLGDDYDDDY